MFNNKTFIILVSIVVLVILLLVDGLLSGMPIEAWQFPRFTLVILMGLTVFEIFRYCLEKHKQSKLQLQGHIQKNCNNNISYHEKKRVVITLSLSFLYFISIYFIGYIIATIVFTLLTIFLFGYKKHTMYIFTAFQVGILYFIFIYIFRLPLPKGLLFNWYF